MRRTWQPGCGWIPRGVWSHREDVFIIGFSKVLKATVAKILAQGTGSETSLLTWCDQTEDDKLRWDGHTHPRGAQSRALQKKIASEAKIAIRSFPLRG